MSGSRTARTITDERGELVLKFKQKKRAPVVPKVPKVQQLLVGDAARIAPSDAIRRKLGDAALVVGVDIETNDWVDRNNTTSIGQFGFYHFCHPEDLTQKIVQTGWAVCETWEGASAQESKEYLVRPEGFSIADKATSKHGITHDLALNRGSPLHVVLDAFMNMIEQVDAKGGRLVVHHLEFDAGIIDRQLGDAGLGHWRSMWAAFARNGICTMDPDLGSWVQRSMGRDVAPDERSTPMMSLKTAAKLLLPRSEFIKNLEKHCHTAGADAQLQRLLYIALRSLAGR